MVRVRDLPIAGRVAHLVWRERRYRCQGCGRTVHRDAPGAAAAPARQRALPVAPVGVAAAQRLAREALRRCRQADRGLQALVEDVLQEVCLKASRRGGCRGQSPGEVYNWLRSGTLNRGRDELKGGFERHELLVDWSDEQGQPHHTSAGADAEVLDREQRHELELPRMHDRCCGPRGAPGATAPKSPAS